MDLGNREHQPTSQSSYLSHNEDRGEQYFDFDVFWPHNEMCDILLKWLEQKMLYCLMFDVMLTFENEIHLNVGRKSENWNVVLLTVFSLTSERDVKGPSWSFTIC